MHTPAGHVRVRRDWPAAVFLGLVCGLLSSAVLMALDSSFQSVLPASDLDNPVLTPFFIANMVVGGLSIGPALETVIFQVLPFEWIGTDKARKVLAMALSVALFSLAHMPSGGIGQAVPMILMGAWLIGLYAWARPVSLRAAFVLTLTTHAMHNACVLVVALHS